MVETLVNDDFEILKEKVPGKWEFLKEKQAYPMNISRKTMIIKNELIFKKRFRPPNKKRFVLLMKT